MSNLSRLRYVVAANINALIEKAEDPEKLLRALIREMDDAREEARLACAELLAEQQRLVRVEQWHSKEAARWQERAETAVNQGRDDLARDALRAGREIRAHRDATRDEQKSVTDRVARMDTDMATLKSKLAEAKGKLRDLQENHARRQPAAKMGNSAMVRGERKARCAMARFDRLQAQVDSLEARVRSYDVGGPVVSPWNTPVASADPVIEEELTRIKNRLAQSGRTGCRQEEV